MFGKIRAFAAVLVFIGLTGCVSPVKDLVTLDESQVGNLNITNTRVTYSAASSEKIRKMDEELAARFEKEDRYPDIGEAKKDEPGYADLPLSVTMEAIVRERLSQEAPGEKPVSIDIEIDTLKLANSAMVFLVGDTDQLAGLVQVRDNESDQIISEFYVDVMDGNAGLLGMAVRGGGVREKLASQFAEHIVNKLYGTDR